MTEPPEPLFILTCMRSYSSLASAMLGQHSGLYVLPEINPFVAETLGDSVDALTALRPRSLDGLYRLIAELEFGGQDFDTILAAKDWVAERRGWTPPLLMGHIRARVAPRRVIEKSPSTAVTRDGLARALALFPGAHFLQLCRHPVATCASIARVTKYGAATGLRQHFVKDPEDSWVGANAGILAAARHLAPDRFMTLRGEDLLTDPEAVVTQIAEWLDLDTHAEDLAAIHHPERSPFSCYGPRNAPYGADPSFLENPRFEKRAIALPSLTADLGWAEGPRRLRPETVALAHQLGYTYLPGEA